MFHEGRWTPHVDIAARAKIHEGAANRSSLRGSNELPPLATAESRSPQLHVPFFVVGTFHVSRAETQFRALIAGGVGEAPPPLRLLRPIRWASSPCAYPTAFQGDPHGDSLFLEAST